MYRRTPPGLPAPRCPMSAFSWPWKYWLVRLVLAIAMLYGALLAGIWWGQEALLFAPQRLPQDHVFKFGDDVQERWVEVPGARLNALHLQLPNPKGVVFFLHGNSGNLQSWFVNTDFYRRANFDMFMIDYRGYGKSSGSIQSQAQLESDVLAAWNQMAPQYAGKRRVVFGRSIGTGLASSLAARVQPEQTVLVSPYESMLALAQQHYPWVPAALLRYPLRSDLVVPQLQGALLLAHGEQDTLIPPVHSQKLQQLLPNAKLTLVPGAGHNDLQRFDVYLGAVRAAMVGP